MIEYPASSAYIIAAQSEEGRRSLATDFAAGLICIGSGQRPCHSCPSCRKAFSEGHPDIIRLSSYEGDKRKTITVAQAREIIKDAGIMPNEARIKTYIIDNAEDMNIQAQNAMLKLLEEPPRGVCVILCVSNPSALLPTVLSRCSIIRSHGDARREEPNADAAEYLDLISAGDTLGLVRFAADREGMDSEALGLFIDAVRREQLSRLMGEDSAKSSAGILPILDTLRSYVDYNVGVKHIWGRLMSVSLDKDN
jgi:hypothetical protein